MMDYHCEVCGEKIPEYEWTENRGLCDLCHAAEEDLEAELDDRT